MSSAREYSVKVTRNAEEDKQLIETGFEYVTEREDFQIRCEE